MSGNPKRQAVLTELQRLADQADVAGPLDYVLLRLESGDTILTICEEVALVVGARVYAGALERALISLAGDYETLRTRLASARRKGASVMAEEAKQIADNSSETPGAVAKARSQSDARFKLAAAYDRETFGTAASPSLVLNVGALHLAALRKVNEEHRLARETAALLTPSTDVTDLVEIVES